MVHAVQQEFSFSQLLITQTHLYASISFPPQGEGGGLVLIKQVQSLQQLFRVSFKSQPHQLNRCRDTNHIGSVRPSSDPGLAPGMSSVCWADMSLAHPSPNTIQISETSVHASLSPERGSEKKQEAGYNWNQFFSWYIYIYILAFTSSPEYPW